MRRSSIMALLVAGLITSAGYKFAKGQEGVGADFRIVRGKQIAPVALSLAGKNVAQIYLGSYFVNAVGGCNECHSCPSYKGTDPFQVGGLALGPPATPGPVNSTNYLAGGVPFGPAIRSVNLTPDSMGRPGGMTLTQFQNAMVNGIDSTDGEILQVMPWPAFRHMGNGDLEAIYAYLSALPPAQPGTCTGSGQTGQ